MTYTVTIEANGKISYIHEYDNASKARAFATRKLNAYDKQGISASAKVSQN